MDTYARHPGEVDDSIDHAKSVHLARVSIATMIGALAALLLAMGIVVAVATHYVLDRDEPGRALVAFLSVPEVRESIADDMAADLISSDEATGRAARPALSAADRVALRDALVEVMAAEEFHESLVSLRIVDGRIDTEALLTELSNQIDEQARSSTGDVRRLLVQMRVDLDVEIGTATEPSDGTAAELADYSSGIGAMRRAGFMFAALPVVPGLVLGLLAAGVAPRRGLAWALVLSGAALLAAGILAPGRFLLESLSGSASTIGHTFAAFGAQAGPGTTWALLLASLLPVALWWALHTWRGQRESNIATS